jgi:signal peptidase
MGAWSDRILSVLIVILLIAVAALACAPRFGWRADAVLSGSMEPALATGGVILTRPVPPEELRVGDIITFDAPHGDGFVSHRITAIEHGPPLAFRTKGDANEDPDPFPVSATAIRGVVVLHVPYLGLLSQAVRTLPGFICTILVPGLVIIAFELKSLRQGRRERSAECRKL